MLGLASFFVLERSFATVAEVKRLAGTALGVPAERLEALLFFATAKQQSWFVASPDRVALVTDRRDAPRPAVQWSVPLAAAREAISVGSKSSVTGTIALAGRPPRYYSKPLFADAPICTRLLDMLDKAQSNASRAA